MSGEKIRVIRKKPGRDPEVIQIDNTLKALQKEVEGYIETVTIATDAVIVCNEEGLLIGLPPNCDFGNHSFVGTILVVGADGEEFADIPVPDERFWTKQFKPWRSA